MKAIHLLLLPLGLSALIWAPRAAPVANMIIDDASPNDTITFSASGFFSFSAGDQTVIFQGSEVGPATVQESSGPVAFSGSWNSGGNAGAGSRTIYLLENPLSGQISDILSYSWTTGGPSSTISGTFTCDFENNLGLLSEGVNPNDVFGETASFAIPPFLFPSLTGQVISDPVPEPGPGIVGLVTLLGLCGFGLARRVPRRPARWAFCLLMS